MEKQHNYFYRIENTLNGKFYYGVHSTNNLEDGYLGSGKRISYAVKKYGKENLQKVILDCKNSDFIQGNNGREWRADFDWITQPKNFIKILEGNYKNKTNGNSNNNSGSNSNSGYKPATVDREKLIQELTDDAANGNIPGVY